MKQFFKMLFASFLGIIIASLLSFFLLLSIVFSLASVDTNQVAINKPSWLEIDISGVIYDRYEANPLDALFSTYSDEHATSLIDILTAIDRAKENPNIVGVFLKCNPMMAGYATAKEIRDKLEELQKSGRVVIAYADAYSQKSYYVASVADQIYLNPLGVIELSGLAVNKTYFKGTLDKLGVGVQVFKVGTYKSAVEPFINKSMSAEDRAQTDSYLQSIWGTIRASIVQSRKIDSKQLDQWIGEGLMMEDSKELISKKLISGVAYESDLKTTIKSKKDSSDQSINLIKLNQFLASTKPANSSADKIALVFAEGEIDGSQDAGIVSKKLIKELVKIHEDDQVKAVVFRVNSPGGSAFGSDQIWHELNKIKKKKPVVVSMGDYAASGGYYISCMADAVVAQPTTLTGSIGVFGLVPNIEELWSKIGLSQSVAKTHQLSDFGDITRPMTELEKKMVQGSVDRIYQTFLSRCSDGRGISTQSVDSIAQGRVWSGQQARDLKLVDQLGGLSKAFEVAAKKAKLSNYEVVEYPAKKEWFEKVVNDLNSQLSMRLFSIFSSEEKQVVRKLRKVYDRDRVRAEMGVVPVLD